MENLEGLTAIAKPKCINVGGLLKEVGGPRENSSQKDLSLGNQTHNLLGEVTVSPAVWFHHMTSTGLGKAVHYHRLFCLIVALAVLPHAVPHTPSVLDFSNRRAEFIMARYLAGSRCVNTGVPNNANQACISFNSCWLSATALSHQL